MAVLPKVKQNAPSTGRLHPSQPGTPGRGPEISVSGASGPWSVLLGPLTPTGTERLEEPARMLQQPCHLALGPALWILQPPCPTATLLAFSLLCGVWDTAGETLKSFLWYPAAQNSLLKLLGVSSWVGALISFPRTLGRCPPHPVRHRSVS